MMEQYRAIKEQHSDAILFFRLGDFYEMFFEDARTASRELEIVLTARDGGAAGKVPMCGVPFHSADTYIAKLIEKGYRVAICEQVEDAKQARGLVKREVIKVITPGTVLDNLMLEEGHNNYLVAVVEGEECLGLAAVDVSTGEFRATEMGGPEARSWLCSELYRLDPSECLIPAWNSGESVVHEFSQQMQQVVITEVDPKYYRYEYAAQKLKDYYQVTGPDDWGWKPARWNLRRVWFYLLLSQRKIHLEHLQQFVGIQPGDYLGLDRPHVVTWSLPVRCGKVNVAHCWEL